MLPERTNPTTASLLLLGAVAALWELAARFAGSFLFPTASATALALARLLMSSELWRAVWLSNQALVIGLPLAVLVGVPIGLAMGRSRAADQWLGVHLNILLVTPKSAVMPLILMAFGFGLMTRAIIVSVFAFPVVVVTTRAGIVAIDARLIEMARSLGASERQVWRHILLPGSRPALATAMRLGLARAVAGMVSVELLLVAVGLGAMLLDFQADFDAASVYAVVLVVLAEAVTLIGLASRWERRFGPFRPGALIE
jgi:ABC-type nitrate/sulfonate/bicarbonate transport system permease component